MIVGQDVNKILSRLLYGNIINLRLGDAVISMQAVDDNSKLVLSTQVYNGGNFIPGSVRRCAKSGAHKIGNLMHTVLSIDERQFQIFLKYHGLIKDLTPENFVMLIEEFNQEAEEWRVYLDEHDRNDLIYVPVK